MIQHSIIYKYAWMTVKVCGFIGLGMVVFGIIWVKWIKNR